MNITATQALRTKYIAQTNKRQLYSGILILIFFVLLGSGFYTADDRNAGSFWDGISNIFDFPTEVLSEAEEKLALMPSNLVKFSGALIFFINTWLGKMAPNDPRLSSRNGYFACHP
jgi:phosphonate transport system permease protein